MRKLKPNEVIVTWVCEGSGLCHPVHKRVYLVDPDTSTHSQYLSSATRYRPSEAIEAIRTLRTNYPILETTFIQILGFLPDTENEIPRSPYASRRKAGATNQIKEKP